MSNPTLQVPSEYDELEHIRLLAFAMHSKTYEKPEDRIEVIEKWLSTHQQEITKQKNELLDRLEEIIDDPKITKANVVRAIMAERKLTKEGK